MLGTYQAPGQRPDPCSLILIFLRFSSILQMNKLRQGAGTPRAWHTAST